MYPVPLSLYLHIPFCRKRCTYCDFNTCAGMDDLIAPYLVALEKEIAHAAAGKHSTIHTIYFGGGTPSLLAGEQVEALLAVCRRHFTLTADCEITLEANPGTVGPEKLAAYREAGINRLSLGVQSLHGETLVRFGRLHDRQQAEAAFRQARAAGFENISLDLIYGAPGQSLDEWRETLAGVLAWWPDHLSLYSLSVEEGTPLARQIDQGRLSPPDTDLAADMYEAAQTIVAAAGFIQYEISNWAQPGRESHHNRQYWLNRPYFGLGAGAHSWIAGRRFWNVAPVKEYIRRMDQSEQVAYPFSPALADNELIDQQLEMMETMFLGLRLVREGVDRETFRARFGQPVEAVYGEVIDQLVREGLLVVDEARIKLTPRAYLIANRVFVRF